MKDKYNGIYLNYIVLLILVFVLNFMIVDIDSLSFTNYLLFCITLFLMLVSFNADIILGLIFSIIIIFIFGSSIFYKSITQNIEITIKPFIWMLIFPISALVSARLGMYLKDYKKDIDTLNSRIETSVTLDDLTGFGNAKNYFTTLQREMARSKRYKYDLSMMLIQIEYFDEILSIYGTIKMDTIINRISNVMEKITRFEDEWFRISDNTFSIIMVNTDEKGANVVKQRLKKELDYIVIDDEKYRCYFKISIMKYNDEVENAYEFKKAVERKLEYDV